jgi:hypothetical protein
MSDIMNTVIDVPEDEIKEAPEVIDKDGTPINAADAGTLLNKAKDLLSNISDDKIKDAMKDLEDAVNGARRICTIKFLFDTKIGYRFDIYTHPERVNGKRVVEIKNVYNMFNEVVPELPKRLGDFFKFVGVIRYVFPTTMFPIGDEASEDSVVVTIENNFNDYIKTGKIKGMEIKIDKD